MLEEITLSNKEKLYTLTSECIVHLHDLLSKNYHLIDKMDAVEPPGVKNMDSLESAVYRQKIGSGDWLKYDSVFSNCATLIFGIVKNHAFHNGNKRVAFLAMIKHLFENGYVTKPDTRHDDIYRVLLALADNNLEKEIEKIDRAIANRHRKVKKASDELQVDILRDWLRKISESKSIRLKTTIKIQTLREMLEKKGIYLEMNGTFMTLYQVKNKKILGFIKSGTEQINVRTYGLGNSMTEIGPKVLLLIRKDYGLTHSEGFDNKSFYDTESFIDQEMITYKKIIYKLSQT